MRAFICLIAVAVLHSPSYADEWMGLFNRKDLTGWRANNDPESFTVADGVLRIQATGDTSAHLFYVGDHVDHPELFKNFELSATVRAEPNSNGGIFIHTDETTRNAALHLARGYEVQLNSSARERRKTGSLYAIVDLDKSPVDETHWFEIQVSVRDRRITVAVQGEQIVDYIEPVDVERPPERRGRRLAPDGGAIALQAHDAGSVWYFKEIRVRRLP